MRLSVANALRGQVTIQREVVGKLRLKGMDKSHVNALFKFYFQTFPYPKALPYVSLVFFQMLVSNLSSIKY